MRVLCWIFGLLVLLPAASVAQTARGPVLNPKRGQVDRFRQLEEILPTPNIYRTASGAPGHAYWQQRADYVIDVELDDEKQELAGSETITYHNQSPDPLEYMWVQLEANLFAPRSHAALTETAPSSKKLTFDQFDSLLHRERFDGRCHVTAVKDGNGRDLKYTIVDTMMRVDLPRPLQPQDSFKLRIDWHYPINDATRLRARTGFEFFEKDGNYVYEMAQWYPRVVAYTDVTGWQHKQFLGAGEFTLEFGDYLVRITAPDDHLVPATGVLLNRDEILTENQLSRLETARTAKEPVFIVTLDEAKENETTKPTGKKTWIYQAENVRDFAFASSRKFLWDAVGHNVGDNLVWAMSFYPKEAEPLWSKYSTHAIVHTLDVYSKFSFDYPYPTAISVNGPVYGMEYPMICFNGPRPEEDGTYSARTKYGLISVVIHEVGHNYFPMIVNTDERQWTWMDEGINTFLQYLAESEWEDDYPSNRGEPREITSYMRSSQQVPIMTNSESILQFGPNAYAKPATALNILRETVLGRELFDFAFKEYSQRWQFKRPQPADFFRTMEDASGVDLDWFWYGWFYTTWHVDLSIEGVTKYRIDTRDPDVEKPLRQKERDAERQSMSEQRNESLTKRTEIFPGLKDFYNDYDDLDVNILDKQEYAKFLDSLDEKQKELLATKKNFYEIDIRNVGGLVMPVLLELEYENGKTAEIRVPAEIWRKDGERISKLLMTDEPVKLVRLDPRQETADTDMSNNVFPREIETNTIELRKSSKPKNIMQKLRDAEKKESEDEG